MFCVSIVSMEIVSVIFSDPSCCIFSNLQGAVQVTRSDVIRLQENVFLNDTIIDFYLRQASFSSFIMITFTMKGAC